MLHLDAIYLHRYALKAYREKIFVKPTFETGLVNPYLFIADKKHALTASHYTLSPIEDRGYDIYVVTSEQQVLFYLIDVKYPYVRHVVNGLIIRNRKKSTPNDAVGVKIRYNMDHFLVLTNEPETCTIIGVNLTSDPKT